MANFEELINHPNFGKLYSDSLGFRSLVTSQLKSAEWLQDTMPSIRMISEDGEVGFSIVDDYRKFKKTPGEKLSDLFSRVIGEKEKGFSRVRRYTTSRVDSTMTGGYQNKALRDLAEMYGIEFEVRSFPMGGDAAAAHLKSQFRDKGTGIDYAFIKPDTETSTVLTATRGGKRLSEKEISNIFNMDINLDSKWAKRFGGVLNEHAFTVSRNIRRKEAPLKVFTMEAADYFSKIPHVDNKIGSMAKEIGLVRGNPLSKKEITDLSEDIFSKLGDGTIIGSETHLKKILNEARREKNMLEREISKLPLISGSAEDIAKKKQLRKLKELISRHERAFKAGGMSGITRIYNAQADQYKNGVKVDSFAVEHAKGEMRILRDLDFIKILRAQGVQGDDKKLLAYDMITLKNNIINGEIGNVFKGDLSVQTFEPLPKAKFFAEKPYSSNTLTTAAYGEFVGTEDYLPRGLLTKIDSHIKDIESGKMTPGLKALLSEMEDTPLDGLTAADAQRLRESKEFVKRIRTHYSRGGDLSKDPFLTKQFVDQVKKHYFKASKNGKMSYNARFPMMGATSAHLSSAPVEDIRNQRFIAGMIAPNQDTNAFVLQGFDIARTHRAFGGFDLDDSVYGRYIYDSKAKRLMYQTLRDPTAMGEYFMFDVDISNDKNIPVFIREEYKKQREILDRLSRKTQTGAKRDMRDLVELNKSKETLHQYFSGKKYKGVEGADFVQQMDLQALYERGMPSPTGWKSTTRSRANLGKESAFLSFHQIGSEADVAAARKIIRNESKSLIGNVNNRFSIFEYAGDVDGGGYSEYNQMFDFMKGKPKVSSTAKKFSAEETYRIIEDLQKQGNVLGSVINQYSLIDSFISSHLDYSGNNQVPIEIRNKLKELLNDPRYQLSRIDRELIIDSATQKSNEKVTARALRELNGGINEKGVYRESNMELLGKIMRELQNEVEALGLEDKFHIGLDPIVKKERLTEEQINLLNIGFGEGNYTLDEGDIKATQSRLYKKGLGEGERLDSKILELDNNAREALSVAIGNDYTPEQKVVASRIIADFEESKRMMRGGADADTALAKALGSVPESGIVPESTEHLLYNFTSEGVHIKTAAQLDTMGSKDLLAIARVLLDSGGSFEVLAQSGELPGTTETVADIYTRALGEKETLKGIRSVKSMSDLNEFLDYNSGQYSFSARANSVIDIAERNREIVEAIQRVKSGKASHVLPSAWDRRYKALKDFGKVNALDEFLQSIPGPLPDLGASVNLPNQIGALAAGMRAQADEAAQGVLAVSGNKSLVTMMKRMDLTTAKAAKSGLIAIAAFAGFGIAHRIITGDRSVEQMNPHPLIPEGSNYESILRDGNIGQNMGSTQGSMSYRIRALNVGDTERLSQGIQGVLPQGNTTIYNSNAYAIGNYTPTSRSILRERLGQ